MNSMKEEQVLIGMRPLMEALDSGQNIQKVLVQQGLQGDLFHKLFSRLRKEGIPCQTVPVQRLERVTKSNHQGVIAYISPIRFTELEDLLESMAERTTPASILMLDGVTDVRNFGAIARSAECFGFDSVVIGTKGASPVNAEAIKSSAGALLRLAVCRVNHMTDAMALCQQYGLKVVAATEKGSEPISEIDLTGPICLVLGNEEKGVSTGILRRADHLARIDMAGQTASLNVSVAGGIFCHEVLKQRKS